MHEQDKAILHALVPVAWADGVFADAEKQMLDALLDAFGADDAEKAELRAFAADKRTLDDIHLQDLSADDRRVLLQHAVFISWADGDQDEKEVQFLDALAQRLRIPADEAKAIQQAASARARHHLGLLG